MKKHLLAAMLLLLTAPVFACDICGCGVGSYYIGILPEFNKKIIGIRYRYNSLKTHIGAGGQTSYLTTRETFHTAEVWGGWNISRKFRVMGYIPVNFNEKKSQETTASKTGLGDMGVQGFYKLFDQRKTIGSNLMVHALWLGAGLKLPTGKYESPAKDQSAPDANLFQLGTGSTDFTVNAMYDLRIQDAGINAAASYKINTANSDDYRYGNRLSASMQAYYKFRILNAFTLSPNAGVLYETAEHDKDAGFSTDVSGGNLLLGTAGLEAAFAKFAIGAGFQHPLSQDLAGGFVKANSRAMVHISFLL
ncbi:transporter [Pseudoflavitalea sp. G-6-1-2]|uniref:transporter n=1 Tax=Pseudoflavitalea sp. G-6-1-2 TaxID=2728841 RepID=UPI00146C772F|nr:transporter [Pseudoflavitalea sp. G-6-1-2]NML21965.1 transporter [Pseudoflavitalea sp. G-6-1-2]